MSNRVFFRGALGVITVAGLAAGANAGLIFSGSSGSLAAEVEFNVSGTDLIVRLTNSSTSDVLVPADILTGVFFHITGPSVSLSRTSAVVPGGSAVHFGTTDPGNVVGGEWAYVGSTSGGPSGAGAHGISSAGLGLFGDSDRFPGNNLQGPESVDGLQYGITSAGDNLATGNGAVTGGNALIKDSVVFTLGGLPVGFDLGRIGGVSFQYGTGLNEPSFPGVPAPGAVMIGALAGAAAMKRRR